MLFPIGDLYFLAGSWIGDFQCAWFVFLACNGDRGAEFILASRAQDPVLARSQRSLEALLDFQHIGEPDAGKAGLNAVQSFQFRTAICDSGVVNLQFQRREPLGVLESSRAAAPAP